MDSIVHQKQAKPPMTSTNIACQLSLRDVLRYPLTLLHLFGCVDVLGNPAKAKHKLVVVHCSILALVHVAYLVRNLTFLWYLSTQAKEEAIHTAQKLLFHIYATVTFVIESVVTRQYLGKVFRALEQYETVYGFLSDKCKAQRSNKIVCFLLLLLNVISCMIWSSVYLFWYKNSRLFQFPLSESYSKPTLIIWGYTLGLITFTVTTSVALFCILYSGIIEIVVTEFRCIGKEMVQVMAHKSSEVIEAGMIKCRERHRLLCQATAILSQMTRTFVSLNLLFDVCYVFFTIYSLGNNITSDVITSMCSTMFCVLLFVIVIPLKWGRLPAAANKIRDAVLNTSWEGKSTTVLQKMNLIIAEGSSGKIGIDVFGFFVLDYSTLVMIASLVATYGLVVVQFHMDDQKTALPASSSNTSFFVLSRK